MPSPYDGPNSSGVGDNAFGKYWAGNSRNGGGMFSNNRQMKQYMQMRRDEMSHGAFLQDQLAQKDFSRNQQAADADFNRTSVRENSANAVNDWQKSRNTFHTGEVRKTDPNITGYKTDGPSFSFTAEPGLHATGRAAQERFQEMQDTGSPLVTPPAGGPARPASVKSVRTQAAITGGAARPALPAPAGKKPSGGPRGKRDAAWVQQTLPGMRNTRQFKDTTLPASSGSPATSTPITSGNEPSSSTIK